VARRIGIGRQFVSRRAATAPISCTPTPARKSARAAHHAAPDRVLAETALLDFLPG